MGCKQPYFLTRDATATFRQRQVSVYSKDRGLAYIKQGEQLIKERPMRAIFALTILVLTLILAGVSARAGDARQAFHVTGIDDTNFIADV